MSNLPPRTLQMVMFAGLYNQILPDDLKLVLGNLRDDGACVLLEPLNRNVDPKVCERWELQVFVMEPLAAHTHSYLEGHFPKLQRSIEDVPCAVYEAFRGCHETLSDSGMMHSG